MKKVLALILLCVFAFSCAGPALAVRKKKKVVHRRYYTRIRFNGPASMRHTTVRPVFPTDSKKLKSTPQPQKNTSPEAVNKKRPIIEVLKKAPPPPRRYLIPAAGAGSGTFLLGLNYQQRLAGKINFLLGGGYGFRQNDSSFTFKAGGLIDLANNFFAGAALDVANYADKDASGLGLFAGKDWDQLRFSVGYSSALGFNALGGYSLII